MNFYQITHCDMSNGDGCRVVLWVAGCDHNCKGCQNPFTHDPNGGILFDKKAKEEIFKDLKEDWCSGLTLSGGDPLYKSNMETVINLCKEVKELYPSKDIWLYTGYYLKEIKENKEMSNILKYIDVLVDGPFDINLKDTSLRFRGSSNQNVIKREDF